MITLLQASLLDQVEDPSILFVEKQRNNSANMSDAKPISSLPKFRNFLMRSLDHTMGTYICFIHFSAH